MFSRTFAAVAAAGALAAGTLVAGAALAQDLVLPSEVAATHWKTGYMNDFAKEVDQKTDGKISVKVFPGGQLYSDREALAAIGTGAVQMVWPVSVRLETIVPQTGVINLPFSLTDTSMQNACMKTGITKMLSDYMKPAGMKVLGLLRTADLLFIFSRDDVKSMDGLKGKKVRITGGRVVQETMRELGVSPVSMAASEMSTALSQGAIDGILTSPAGWSEMIGMTGKYAFYVPGLSLLTYAVVVDQKWFDGLPEDQQKAIQSSVDDVVAKEWTGAIAKDKEALKKMKADGAVLNVADDAQIAEWKKLTAKTSESFSKKYPDAMKRMDQLESHCGISG
ncbi:TRAP transporter substrate-binding protein DctP [Acidimangrovimonas sediminis]|uniref:TRAP transporter substrate-binding protein DctP n=1 Tax=Acidimangrovimonas sediminis TaxID=2056283 RepID=UPI000C80D210|nr:TRAP transporter substrate-binding protein DctP [Acidimangrovimonas sediminis]